MRIGKIISFEFQRKAFVVFLVNKKQPPPTIPGIPEPRDH